MGSAPRISAVNSSSFRFVQQDTSEKMHSGLNRLPEMPRLSPSPAMTNHDTSQSSDRFLDIHIAGPPKGW